MKTDKKKNNELIFVLAFNHNQPMIRAKNELIFVLAFNHNQPMIRA